MADYRNDPVVHIFADTETATARMRQTADSAGCRVVSTMLVGKQGNPSPTALPGALILIELENEAAGEDVMPLLDWLEQEVARDARRGIVSAPLGLIDLVAGSAGHSGIEHLCEADEAERLAALARATEPPASRVRDDGGASAARILQPSPDYASDSAGPADLAFIRAMLRARRLRDAHFPADLFADPAWDILLDLMAARLERKQVTVSSVCVAAAVPPTTALRWITVLTARGLVVRLADAVDRRRVYIQLSEASAQALGRWLRQTRRLASDAL